MLDPATVNRIPITERIAAGFTSAINNTMGPAHYSMVKQSSRAFKNFYQREEPALPVLLWTSILLTALALILSLRWSLAAEINMTTVYEHAAIGMTALLVSAFIGFVSNYCNTPSRLTGVPSIGLMISICAGLETALACVRRFKGWKKVSALFIACVLFSTVFAYSVKEAKAFTSFLRQAGEVHDVDLRLARKIKLLHPSVTKDEEIFVRTPRAAKEVAGRWTNFWSGFNSGRANESLWYLYDVDPGYFRFTCTPDRCPGEDERMQQIIEEWSKHAPNMVSPFYIDEKENVFAIETMELTDKEGRVLKSLDFSKRFVDVPREQLVTQRIPILRLPPELN
jgi:hypothetical protein